MELFIFQNAGNKNKKICSRISRDHLFQDNSPKISAFLYKLVKIRDLQLLYKSIFK